MLNIQQFADYKPLLKKTKSIAVVGLSPKEVRPSNMVARYLIDTGYTVYPVNPGHDSILGLPCYPNISEVPVAIDIVNIFRRSEDVLPIVEEAVKLKAAAIWMQLGIINNDAAVLAREHGLDVVMDKCIKVEHEILFPSISSSHIR